MLSCIEPKFLYWACHACQIDKMMCSLTSRHAVMVTGCCKAKTCGFIKVLNRRATGFDIQAKNCQGLCTHQGSAGAEILLGRDEFSCILKLQAKSFNYQNHELQTGRLKLLSIWSNHIDLVKS